MHRVGWIGLVLAGCGGDDAGPAAPAGTDTDPPPISDPPCGGAEGALPDGLVELAWDDGNPTTDLEAMGWSVTGLQGTYALGEEPGWEAVRFELAHPAVIHGFSVAWTRLPANVEKDIKAGLYGDFGYNGFDFWTPDPLWEGARCRGDLEEEQWATWVLDEPLVIDHPGLVYVAHHRRGSDKPGFAMDGSSADDCGVFDACHSSVNMPDADAGAYFNGLTLSLPNDYLVRLHVAWTDDVSPSETIFQPVPDGPAGYRQAWGDYDDDGWDDLLAGGATLWHNLGDGSFEDVTSAAGLDGLGASGGVWGDYDNDGCLDLFAFRESYAAGDTLLHSNCDGTFSDVTALAGIDDLQDYNLCEDNPDNNHAPSPAAAWWDIDTDGLLDLYVVNFNCWDDYSFYTDTVFRNAGDGTFTEWTGLQGFSDVRLPGRGASPADHDGDGDVDMLVHNYVLDRNLFYLNHGDGTVTEQGEAVGLAGHEDVASQFATYFGHTIGSAWGDLDNDGDLDSVQANLAHPRFFDFSDKTQILLNDGGTFTDIAGDWALPASDAGLRYQETHSVPVLADFDQDGVLDLAISAVYDGRPTDFYWGRGDGTFRLDSYHAGLTTENGWGMAVADHDGDGDMDLAVHGGLFENTGAAGSWLQVRAVGNVASNWAAIGATVSVFAGNQRWIRHVQGGSGQGCQDSQTVHFGLGALTRVDRVEVAFPGGGTVRYDGPFDSGQRLWAYEDGAVHAGWGPPG